MGLAGKVALVTGASSGIGLAAARLFASKGAKVALVGRNSAVLEKLSSELDSSFAITADISEPDQVETMVQKAVDHFGQIDILVNSAGVLAGGALGTASLESFDKNFNTNARGVFTCCTAAIPHLEKTKGNIINVSSVNGSQSFAGVAAYCASKSAVDQLTRCGAVDLAGKGIRVNAVSPGVTRSDLQKRGGLDEEAYQNFLERSKVTHPLGRIAEPEEVGELIAFLGDNDLAGFITGAIIPIDGGRACLGAR